MKQIFTGVMVGTGLGLVVGVVVGIVIALVYGDRAATWTFWSILFLGALSGGLLPWWDQAAETRRSEEYEKEARESLRLQMHAEAELQCGYARNYFGEMSRLLDQVTKDLAVAEQYIKSGDFSLFWDPIEDSTRHLAKLDYGVRHLLRILTVYHECRRRLDAKRPDGALPVFPFDRASISAMQRAPELAMKLTSIAHDARRDVEFAKVYELRRSNPIQVSGFGDFGSTLGCIVSKLSASIGGLASAIESGGERR